MLGERGWDLGVVFLRGLKCGSNGHEGRRKFPSLFHRVGELVWVIEDIYLNWRRLVDGVVGRVRGVATHRRFLPLGLGRGLLENLIFFSFISDNSFGSVDDFLISVRCYVMILLLGIFYISPLLFLVST